MRTIAERLVLRPAAAAQRDPVPDLILVAVGCDDRYPASDVDGATHPESRVLDQGDGGLEQRLIGLSRFRVDEHVATRRTQCGLFLGQRPRLRVPALVDEVPQAAAAIAEASLRTEIAHIAQADTGTVDALGALEVGVALGRLRSVEADAPVREIAEGLVA